LGNSLGWRSRTLATIAGGFLTPIRRSPSQEPLESSTIVEPVAIVTRPIFSVPLRAHMSRPDTAPIFPVQQAALFLPLIFSGTASGKFLRPAASGLLLSRFLP